MKPGLSLRLSQHLTLTPQLQQSIRLLQMSTVELEQEVDRYLQENPFLERADGEDAPPAEVTTVPLGLVTPATTTATTTPADEQATPPEGGDTRDERRDDDDYLRDSWT